MDREARREWRMQRREWHAQRRADCGSGPGRLLIGLIVVSVGVLFLLENLGLLYVRNFWEFWPVILIVMGVSRLASSYTASGRVWGAIVGGVGCVFLAQNLGFIPWNIWRLFWPLILVAVGLGMIFRGAERRSFVKDKMAAAFPPNFSPPRPFGSTTISANAIHEWVVFGGVKRRVESQAFEGGDALAIFGGVEIDLRGASTQLNQIHIEANAMFGGVEIRVPDSWTVTVQGQGIFGGYEDETRPPVRTPDNPGKPNLIISGSALFGGVSVKN